MRFVPDVLFVDAMCFTSLDLSTHVLDYIVTGNEKNMKPEC
jgi:hypothetical protein